MNDHTADLPNTIDSLVRDVARLYIDYDVPQKVTKTIEGLHRHGRAGLAANCLLVVGPSGCGKTSILDRYVERHPLMDTAEGVIREVLSISAPARCSIKNLAETVLAALGDPAPNKGTEGQLTRRLLHQLAQQRVGLLIIDESQHAIDKRSHKVVYDVADWIKNLINEAVCPIVLAGLPETKAILETNKQLARRCCGVLDLSPFDWDKEEEQLKFRGLLRFFEHELPFVFEPALSSFEMASRIHYATGGLIGEVARLLQIACLDAAEAGLRRVSMAMLAEAYSSVALTGEAAANPFLFDISRSAAAAPRDARGTRLRGRGPASGKAKSI